MFPTVSCLCDPLVTIVALDNDNLASHLASVIDPNWDYVSTTPGAVYTPADILFNEIGYITTVLYFSIMSTTKLGILLLYKRLFFASDTFRRLYISCVPL
ncbi:hypothetical protein F5Y16DRAFT_384151 [Xylariaceae sp. FL0255]|nr:hypothetical protein F5Y16DRAFT_384151 [Xylariaceae sp. FL0255]